MCKDSKKKLHFTIIFLIMVRFLDKLVLVFLVFVENSVARLSLSDGSLLLPFTSKERTPVSHRLRASACAKWMIEPLEGVIDLMIDGHSGSGSGFGLSSFLRRSVEDAIESRGVHIPSALRHHRHKHEHEADDDRDIELPHVDHGYVKNRSLPLSLHGNFGKDTSPKVKNFMKLGLGGSLAKVS